MIYLQPRRKQGLKVSMPIQIGAIIVAVLFVFSLFVPNAIQGTVQTIVYPFWQFSASMSNFFGGASSSLFTKTALLEENNQLRQQMRTAEHLSARSLMLQRENNELKKLLGKEIDFKGVLAPILARPPRLSYDTLILGAGLSDSIETGDRVYLADNVVIGEITAVYPQTSLVTLFSTPGRETDVRVGTSTVTALGRGLGSYIIEAPRELMVATGTPVSLPGLAPSLLGYVVEKEAHPADPVEKLYVQSPYALSSVDFVQIIPKNIVNDAVDKKEEDVVSDTDVSI